MQRIHFELTCGADTGAAYVEFPQRRYLSEERAEIGKGLVFAEV